MNIEDCTKHCIPNKTKWVPGCNTSHVVFRSSNIESLVYLLYVLMKLTSPTVTQFVHHSPAVARLVGVSQLSQSMACSIKSCADLFSGLTPRNC